MRRYSVYDPNNPVCSYIICGNSKADAKRRFFDTPVGDYCGNWIVVTASKYKEILNEYYKK